MTEKDAAPAAMLSTHDPLGSTQDAPQPLIAARQSPAPDTDRIMALAERMVDSKSYVEAYIEARAALRAAVEQLAKDAARYRWLRGGADVPTHSTRWGRWEINHWEGANGWRNLLCSELDAAIDAAMKEGSPPY